MRQLFNSYTQTREHYSAKSSRFMYPVGLWIQAEFAAPCILRREDARVASNAMQLHLSSVSAATSDPGRSMDIREERAWASSKLT